MPISINTPVVWTSTNAGKPATIAPDKTPLCCPTQASDYPIRRLIVDYRVEGGARITWEMDSEFTATDTLLFQLQASQSGVPDADDWVDVGELFEEPAFLVDDEKRMWGMSTTLHYRVIVIDGLTTYTSFPSKVSTHTNLLEKDWLYVRELFRKEKLNMTLNTGVNGYLLKEKRYGVVCDCVDPITKEQMNSSCLDCYGRNFVGGYHSPLLCEFGELSQEEAKEFVGYAEARGTVKDVVIFKRCLANVPIVSQDAWITATTDERYMVHSVRNIVEHRGVPIVYAVELRLQPKSDILYKVELPEMDVIECKWGRPDLEEVVTICAPMS